MVALVFARGVGGCTGPPGRTSEAQVQYLPHQSCRSSALTCRRSVGVSLSAAARDSRRSVLNSRERGNLFIIPAPRLRAPRKRKRTRNGRRCDVWPKFPRALISSSRARPRGPSLTRWRFSFGRFLRCRSHLTSRAHIDAHHRPMSSMQLAGDQSARRRREEKTARGFHSPALARGPRERAISRGPAFIFAKGSPGPSLSLSLPLVLSLAPPFSRWLQVPLGARLSLSPPAAFNFPNDRLTQCWKLALGGSEGGTRRRKREKKRRRNETHRGRAEAAFYDELYDFPPRARTPPIAGPPRDRREIRSAR